MLKTFPLVCLQVENAKLHRLGHIFRSWCDLHMQLFLCVCMSACLRVYVFALDKIQFMKLPLRNGGATNLRNVTDRDCTDCTIQWHSVYTVTILARASTLQLVARRALLYSTTTFCTVRVYFIRTPTLKNLEQFQTLKVLCYF